MNKEQCTLISSQCLLIELVTNRRGMLVNNEKRRPLIFSYIHWRETEIFKGWRAEQHLYIHILHLQFSKTLLFCISPKPFFCKKVYSCMFNVVELVAVTCNETILRQYHDHEYLELRTSGIELLCSRLAFFTPGVKIKYTSRFI